ncbi:c-type cytochrome [Pararhizobium gei]|uniref:c-type cytochrome n=1 Tax=Pararhizobium gei TaxID=1395951 RepID=UPI0023DB2E06|nr:cytochrome c family protein [Rhizobium gei]
MCPRLLFAAFFLCLAPAALAAADAEAGAQVFRKCGACHTATEPVNRVGPSLLGILGRPVATFDGYSYSDAMQAFGDGKIWDDALLSEYLLSPKAMVPGTKMSFPGLKKPGDIADLIAYLKRAAKP